MIHDWLMQQFYSPGNSYSSGFASLPPDLQLEITSWLDTRGDILNLCLTSNHVFGIVSSVLYASVTLNTGEHCVRTLQMLARRPDIGRHVRELIVRPKKSKSLSRQNFSFHENSVASEAVRTVASSMCLEALTTFAWDDEELAFHDDMWFALRVGCPQLRCISTSVGSFLPSAHSHLFDFVDLRGFSLLLRPGFYEANAGILVEDDHPMWQKLWKMLQTKCPNLEELTIDGISGLPMDIHGLVVGRWPKLKRLFLGDVIVDWTPHALSDEKRPFISFLEDHSSLRSLGLSRRNIDSAHLSTLEPDSLKLTTFNGTLQQLQSLRGQFHSLKSLSFRDALQTREVTAPAIASVLQNMSLTKLKIAFLLHTSYDSANLLRSLVNSCPHLKHLDLTCAHKPSFQLDAFAKAIRGFPKLRVLHLTIVRYPGHESLALGAERIAMSNPRLEKFSITLLPPTYPLPLPFALPLFHMPFRTKESGLFTLITDHHGLPIKLRILERRRLMWPLFLGHSSRTKKYVKDLRPPGAPGRRQPGFQGFVDLVKENSAAGEEIRLMLFCMSLVFLALLSPIKLAH
ncbi:hypothetical protein C8J56DRAFT_927034 [Mycena floridula]|nr:hypothetical protein C8J56DRAFT_927034 [Mycena floridula]